MENLIIKENSKLDLQMAMFMMVICRIKRNKDKAFIITKMEIFMKVIGFPIKEKVKGNFL